MSAPKTARLLRRPLQQCLHRPPKPPTHQILQPFTTSPRTLNSHSQSQSQSPAQDESQSQDQEPTSRFDHNPYREDLSAAAKTTPRNPLDPIALHRLESARRAYYTRRSFYAATGAVICMIVPLFIIQFIELPDQPDGKGKARTDAPPQTGETFQGRPVVIEGGRTKVLNPEDGKPGVELVETGIGSVPHFPKTIYLPSVSATGAGKTEDEYHLVGLGIRTVSFLRIQVYIVGIYIRTDDIAALQSRLVRTIDPIATTLVAGEKEMLRQRLLDPEQGIQIWDDVLRNAGLRTAIRIVPTRNTDFAHLRDGWVRGVTGKIQEAARRGSREFEDEAFGAAMQEFRALFGGKGKAPRGSCVLLTRDEEGTLAVWYQERQGKGEMERFGELRGSMGERIGRLVWMGYLAGKSVSSEECRGRVVDGVMEFVGRPVGTVATQVT